ncbi:MAG: hypothetical protein Q4C45_06335, partial [Oscillospiraceae bacterium]|nr:hypothetical protein [Oscillospiraceae bacterium]
RVQERCTRCSLFFIVHQNTLTRRYKIRSIALDGQLLQSRLKDKELDQFRYEQHRHSNAKKAEVSAPAFFFELLYRIIYTSSFACVAAISLSKSL